MSGKSRLLCQDTTAEWDETTGRVFHKKKDEIHTACVCGPLYTRSEILVNLVAEEKKKKKTKHCTWVDWWEEGKQNAGCGCRTRGGIDSSWRGRGSDIPDYPWLATELNTHYFLFWSSSLSLIMLNHSVLGTTWLQEELILEWAYVLCDTVREMGNKAGIWQKWQILECNVPTHPQHLFQTLMWLSCRLVSILLISSSYLSCRTFAVRPRYPVIWLNAAT